MKPYEIDKISIEKAIELFSSGKVYEIEVGPTKGYKKFIKLYLKDYILLPEKFAL